MEPEVAIGLANLAVLALTLVFIAWSNVNVAKSIRLTNLQQMVVEMNRIRQIRAGNPKLEKALFGGRDAWTDEQIQTYLIAVQWANILEWAYLARQEGAITEPVWRSWAQTWIEVILKSESLKKHFLVDEIWTFGRTPKMRADLMRMIREEKIPNP